MKTKMSNSNFPIDGEGRVYHVGVKAGEVANRIVAVGDPARLRRFATFLEASPVPFELVSSRGYTTVTGRYKGVPVTLLAIGMGVAMVDFMVREVRAVVEGDIAVIRFGSCGSLDTAVPVGSIGVPRNAMTIVTNYDHWHVGGEEAKSAPYVFSRPIPSDPVLHEALVNSLNSSVASPSCQICPTELHASADCFYSSQGRIDPSFEDHNEDLIADLFASHPDVKSLEMESAHLFHLAHISKAKGKVSAAACHMVFAGRVEGEFIDPSVVAVLEPAVGKACLDAVIAFEIPEKRLHPAQGSVWAKYT